MAIIKKLTLYCDGEHCHMHIDGVFAKDLRAEARAEGWVHRRGSASLTDLCPGCAERYARLRAPGDENDQETK